MARGFGAAWRPLAEGNPPKRLSTPDIICLHTMVGSLYGTDGYFRQNGYSGNESHFGVGGIWGADKVRDLDGEVWQWVDTAFQADANYEGNHRIISIETADNAPSSAADVLAWTPKQTEAIAQLLARLSIKHGIPLQLVADSKPGRRGVAYHRQGCRHSLGLDVPGFLVTGGERWSTATGKECPTPRRIAQIPGILTRANIIKTELVRGVGAPVPTPTPSTPSTDPTGDEDVEIIDYNGTAYLRSGLWTRKIPGTPGQLAALIERFGSPKLISREEIVLYTDFDKFLEIQGNTARDAKSSAVAGQSAAQGVATAVELLHALAEVPEGTDPAHSSL